MRGNVRSFFTFLKDVVVEYLSDNIIKYSASLAYYTTLSLAPMIIIVIAITGFFFGKEAMRGEIYAELSGLVGSDAAIQIQTMVQNIHLSKDTPFATIVSSIVLLVGATGIFAEIQDSLNKIWGLKTKNLKVWWKLLLDRLISFSLILSLGFVLAVSLFLSALVTAVGKKLNELLLGAGDAMLFFLDNLLTIGITMILFATIFKVLPDARIKWKDVFVGAFITSILFMVGKWLIGYYLGKSNLGTVFGAAGSVIIIMIWIYYTSAILYLGAVFTKVYATHFGGKIYPNEYSMWIKTEEIRVPDVTLHE